MSDTPSTDFSGLDGGDEQQAADLVRDVVTWYGARIAAEHRAPVPDEDRIEELKAGRRTALGDQQRLESAGAQETGRIASLYAARLKELRQS